MMGRNPFRNGEGAIEMSLYNLVWCGVKGVVSEAEPDAALLHSIINKENSKELL